MAFRLLGRGSEERPPLRPDLPALAKRYSRKSEEEAAEAPSAPTPGQPRLKLVWVNPSMSRGAPTPT